MTLATEAQFLVSLQICIKGYFQMTHFRVDNPVAECN